MKNLHGVEKPWVAPLALASLSLMWGYSWVVAKAGLSYAAPLAFAAQRSVLGALSLLAVMKLTGRSFRWEAPRETILMGLIQVAGFMLFQTWALVEGGPGKTAVLIFTMPIWTLVLSWVILGERIRGAQWVAAIGTLTGLVFIIEPWDLHTSLLSKFLGVLAALCWAIGTLMVKQLRRRQAVDLLALTTWQMAVGSAPLALAAWLVPEPPTHWTLTYGGILLFMSVGSTALCWWIWIYILDRIPAWEASLSVLGTPVVAILCSRLITGESFRPMEIAGILLIGAGLILLALVGWVVSRRTGR
jgi:drug/metabolite transporter (DMT)-like permease